MVNGTTTPPPAGAPTPPPAAPPSPAGAAAPKNPIVSAIVSLIIPGLGQIINGQIKKGLILLVAYIVLWVFMMIIYGFGSVLTAGVGLFCCLPVFLVPFLVNIYAAYDAYKTANDINAGVAVADWLS